MKKQIIILGIIGTIALGGMALGGKDEVSAIKLLEKYNASVEIKAKYALEGTTLVKTEIKNPILDKYKGEPKDEIKVTLGSNGTEFTPDIELKRWNEVGFKIKPKGLDLVATKDKNLLFEGDKIKFKTPKMDFEMYDVPATTNDEGSYKYIWYLNEKPTTNIINFDIETSGLSFFYQPELTAEEIAQGAERPPEVVGSYAVYHSTKGGMNDTYGKDYKVGKAFHIYRPHLYDANGLEAWGNLHIENGIYSVEIPTDFLDKAVYPIKSNDTFGYTTKGGSESYIYLASPVTFTDYASKFALTESGTLTSVTGWFTGYLAATKFVMAIYDSSLNLVEQTAEVTKGGSDGWTIFEKSSNLNTNPTKTSGDYWLVARSDGGGNANTRLYFDAGSANQGGYKSRASYSASFASTIDWTANNTNKHSIYVTYTPSGGGAAPLQQDIIWFDE